MIKTPLKKTSKRFRLIFVVILLWILMAVLAINTNTSFIDLSIYFASLTVYVGAYIISETYKQTELTTLMPTERREKITYFSMVLWLGLGIWGMYNTQPTIEVSDDLVPIIEPNNIPDLKVLATYFTSLSAFIALYVFGQHIRPTTNKIEEDIETEDSNDFTEDFDI